MPPRTRSAKATTTAAAPSAPSKAPARTRGKAKAAAATTSSIPVATHAAGSGDDEEAEKPKKKTSGRKRAKDDEDEEDEVVKPSKKKTKVEDDEDDADVKDAKDTKDTTDTKDDDKDEEPKKMAKVIKRGKAPVDPESPYVHSRQVYADAVEVYDAMLNQSSIQRNNNKFYVIQLLHPIGNTNSVYLFTRWGRVGERGQHACKGPWAPATAIVQFKKQFKSKTATDWDNRRSMSGAQNMKYMWVERDYEEEKEVQQTDSNEPIPDSTLEPEVQALCNMIFSTKLLDAALTEMNYDLNKLPLGRLSKNTILQGFSALKKIADVLDNNTWSDVTKSAQCRRLTDEYYSVIPHAFGRDRPRVINTHAILKSELELVDALGDMKIAQTVISDQTPRDANGNPINPLDAHFANLNLKFMDPIKPSSSEYEQLQEYITSTHGRTHTSIRKPTTLHAFRVERHGEGEAWSNGGYDQLGDGEKLLLWHGSRSTNFGGILSQGLRIAPPEAPVTGYMFGKGVYFADAMSKSANYCHSHASNGIGIMLLCEVAARPFFEQTHANYHADNDCKKAKALATKGLGRTKPKEWMDAGEALGHEELKGCWMPKGGLTDDSNSGYLQYNEYIVYSPSQIRLRYLLMVKMA